MQEQDNVLPCVIATLKGSGFLTQLIITVFFP